MNNSRSFGTLLVALIIFSVVSLDAGIPGVGMKIKLNKQEYITSEAVFVDIYLYNNTTKDITIGDWAFNEGELQIIIKDENDIKLIESHATSASNDPVRTRIIKAGEYYCNEENVVERYGQGTGLLNPTTKYFPNGTYTVSAFYNYNGDTVKSNEEKFSVKSPTGIEIQALQLFTSAYHEFNNRNINNAVIIFDSLSRTYTQSAYRPTAYQMLVLITGGFLHDREKAANYSELLMNEYAPSEFAVRGFYNFVHFSDTNNVSKKNKVKIIEDILNHYPGTLLGYHVREYKEQNKDQLDTLK